MQILQQEAVRRDSAIPFPPGRWWKHSMEGGSREAQNAAPISKIIGEDILQKQAEHLKLAYSEREASCTWTQAYSFCGAAKDNLLPLK